jgi:uncharacterized protein YndB with AHSA1/START domain
MSEPTKNRSIITDKLVVPKTGKTMQEWFAIMDKKGAKKMTQTEICQLVNTMAGLEPLGEWNQNLLATSYAWDRGLKERGEKQDGFEIGVSKTIAAPIGSLYDAWFNDKIRKRWLAEPISFRTSSENKSMRINWSDDKTILSVNFYEKGEGKAQVVVQHLKLGGIDEANEMKEFWGKALNFLKELLESDEGRKDS